MTQKGEEHFIEQLLNLVLNHTNTEQLRPLMHATEEFLQKTLEAKELIVFSAPEDHVKIAKHRPDRWLRTVYGKKDHHLSLGLEDSIRDQWSKKSFPQIPALCQISGESLHFIPFGTFDDQFVFGLVFGIPQNQKPIPALLSKFLQKSLKEIGRWREVSRFESLVYVDDVTLLFNQRKLVIDLENAVEQYKKTGEDFSVLFIDLDHFKNINDGHGHLVGTQILADVASVLRGLLRDTDHCYRYGGDEFVILVPNTNAHNAKMIGERILQTITGRDFIINERELVGRYEPVDPKHAPSELTFKLSVSVGVASYPTDATNAKEILAIADQMMYQAKKSGRGQVCFAGEMFKTGS
jgi:diguanylate cyclase (GGDEF)-like protein